jgi:hypothetical protein
LCYDNTNLVFENGHRDFVLSEHKFVFDNLKNMLIGTNLCEIFEFSTQNAEIPHKFVSIKVFFKLCNIKKFVLATQNPCDRFQTQVFLECSQNYDDSCVFQVFSWIFENVPKLHNFWLTKNQVFRANEQENLVF